jgi:UDP-glucose 4-epimerase
VNILLTGGAGYIGSIAAAELLAGGHRVTVYDSLVTGHAAAVPPEATFVQAELADAEALSRTLADGAFDAVLHFAAFIEAGESMKDPGKYFHNNVALGVDLIEACLRAGVRRFILSSTAAVYQTSDEPLTEESPIGPANVYGQTKWMMEQALEWYGRVHGLRFAALRYFNAAGAAAGRGEAHRPESHLIPRLLRVALGREPRAEIFGDDYPTPDGTCVRDYIHISDLVAAHLLALQALDERARLVYNLGNGAGYSVREVLDTARRVSGKSIPAVVGPRRPGDPPRLVASSQRICSELGWQPEHPDLADIVASAWEWHRSHPEGYPE